MTAETGMFWLPEAPEATTPGRLETGDDGVTTVELMGSLTPSMRTVSVDPSSGEVASEPAEDPLDLLVHGRVSGRPSAVTLFDCSTARRNYDFDAQVLRVRRLVRGAHLTPSDRYTGVRVQVTDLERWASLPGARAELIEGVGFHARWDFSDIPTVPIASGGELTVDEALQRTQKLHDGLHITRQLFVEARELGELTYRQISANWVTPIVGYLSFAMAFSASLVAVQVKHDDKWLEVTHPGMKPSEPRSDDFHEPLLPLWVTGLETLSEFLSVYQKVGPAVPVIRDLLSNTRSLTLDTQVLELTTLAEGLHERLFPEQERMSKEEARRVRELVKSALEKEENPRYADIVKGTVLNYLEKPNYKSRLTRLVDEAAPAMPDVCGDRDEWVKRVEAARHNFAHRKEGFIPEELIDETYAIAQSLRWLLMGNILLAAKVPPGVLKERLEQDNRYYYFRRNVRAALPTVFGEQWGEADGRGA